MHTTVEPLTSTKLNPFYQPKRKLGAQKAGTLPRTQTLKVINHSYLYVSVELPSLGMSQK